ncbi:hypothetical protein [Streptosporangium sp. NPDC087985]|uniref:hypothetical protein n=1 Tax=Streptosporangium sp. NPDC087985 TaxID=3366196 RepID=UPI00381460FF
MLGLLEERVAASPAPYVWYVSSGEGAPPPSGRLSPGSGDSPAGGVCARGSGGWPAVAGGSTAGAVLAEVSDQPWSAMADQGWAMIAPVVADTPARRRLEIRVPRREGLRGGMDDSLV